MLRPLKTVLLISWLAAGIEGAKAFSLLGPYDTWQVQTIGYNLPFGADSGGPMNLGEEYRWNTPKVTYGYDQSFLDYFGSDGVAAVEKAIKLLNDLPAVSQMSPDLSEFLVDTRRYNYQASALGLFDLKSYALSALLEEMGLACPERYVWTLRSRVVINNIPFYTTIKRNFDPVTLAPSSYINGTLYTYSILQTFANPDIWEAVDLVVDPYAPTITSVISLADISGGTVDFRGLFDTFSFGLFFDNLTRDDIGALRYIYSKSNFNVENLPPGATPGSDGSPWTPPGGTNQALVAQALRPGVDKLQFVRVDFDSLLGQFIPMTNSYTDTYYTNGTPQQQSVERVITQPDIVFGAQDVGVDMQGVPFLFGRTLASAGGYINNDAINGSTTLPGPGQIQPPIQIVFNKIGPYFLNSPGGGEGDAFVGFTWGSYDASTNAPVLYPTGTSIHDLERRILSQAGGTPWSPP